MVEENILRLELRKLRGFLNARADEVTLVFIYRNNLFVFSRPISGLQS